MKIIFYLYLFALAMKLKAVEGQPQPSRAFPHFSEMGVKGHLRLYWEFNETHIIFEVHGNTSGWVGVGFSPNGGMAGADIYVAWVKDGVARITDRHGLDRNGFPPKDNEQNVELLSGRECDGWTMIKFRRQILSCEDSVDWTLTTDTTRIIWALGLSDPKGNDVTVADYHGSRTADRGTRSLLILEASSGQSSTPEEKTESFDILSDEFNVPPIDTFYNCKLFKLPEFSSKRHLIRVQPIIEEANLAYVHHILVYQCSFNQPQNLSLVGRSHTCYSQNMPDDYRNCSTIMFGWAIGATDFFFPDHVGFPLGEEDSPTHVLMQIHYDNPGIRKDIVDSSGLRFILTDQLREHDAGILEVGFPPLSLLQLIPPKAAAFQAYGECPSVCIERAMEHVNQTEIRLFAALLHSHLLGRKISLKHIASDKRTELPPIAQDNSYDFNYQEAKLLQREISFRKGESMQLVCEYDSRGRKNVTAAGLPTTDEMCLAYMMYYPRVPLTTCRTFPVPSFFYEAAFGITNLTFPEGGISNVTLDQIKATSPEHLSGRTLRSIVEEVDWNEANVSRLEDLQRRAIRGYQCHTVADLEQALPFIGAPPIITQPYQPPEVTCVKPTKGKPTERNVDSCSVMATAGSGYTHEGGSYAHVVCVTVLLVLILCQEQ